MIIKMTKILLNYWSQIYGFYLNIYYEYDHKKLIQCDFLNIAWFT